MSSAAEIPVVILAGGLGTRLQTVVPDRPKVMADVGGRPFLAWILDFVKSRGFGRIIICTGYKARDIEAYFGAGYDGLSIRYSNEATPLGTGGALGNALDMIDAEYAVVMNGDTLCEVELEKLCERHEACEADASLTAVWTDDCTRFGRLVVDANSMVMDMEEKSGVRCAGLINGGVYVVNTRLIRGIPASSCISLETGLLPEWIKGGRCFAVEMEGLFIDIGTPESYARADEIMRGTSFVRTPIRRASAGHQIPTIQ
ncbi:MAG: nucleotidyltransferase family protein [Verrucomicrobia bacterium]|nr:nucleotidyltransferase family protein [Verrucomicrobiota bacterium]